MLDQILQPQAYKVVSDPAATWALIGSLTTTAIGGTIFVGRFLFKNARARKAIGVTLGLEESGNTDLTKVLIEFVHHQEADRQADRQERTRQWERIEEILGAINSQAKEINSLANGMNSIASHFQQLYAQNAATMSRIENSQVNLAIWIYQNLGGVRGQVPQMPFQSQPTPPAQAHQG